LVFLDPRNTSRTCAECGHCEKANRKSQAEFECCHCGHSANADCNAARKIRARGCVKVPMVGSVEAKTGPFWDCG
jgi:transposase